MESLFKLHLKKRLVMRPYQETIVNDIINNFGIQTPYVLGSCPSSGKTEMAIEAMIRLIESGQVNRVLILAHSTNVLKENFYQRLMEYFDDGDTIDVMRGQKNYNYDAKIQVMIPQNINHVIGQFDLIITDEAQHNVLAEDGNYSRIVEMVEPKFQLLLTGTPSKFVRQNDLSEGELPYHINCAGMDMIGFNNFHDVRFDLIKSAYGFTNEDYNQTQDIASDTKFSFAETERTINNVIIGAVMNIAKRNGIDLPKDSNFIAEGRKLVKSGKFGKTLIMCRNIEQADQVADIISKLFKVTVRVSHSGNDGESKELDKFKAGKFEFLCVVNRAREGYDDKKVVNLIDVTMTHNIDLIYQMFCRVVRKDINNQNTKLYLKVTSNAEGMPEYTMNIMTAALMLGSTENLSRFNGSNFRGIVMPRIEREPDDEEDEIPVVNGVVDVVGEDGNTIRRRNISELMALDLVQMFSSDTEDLIQGNERYAMTTLGASLRVLSGEEDFYNNKEGYIKLIRTEKITSNHGWGDEYKKLSERDNVRYHSTPWRIFNQTEKDFFAECYPQNIVYENKEGYFNLLKKEGITYSKPWLIRFKELSDRDGIKYHSSPWKIFGQSEKEFFAECYSDRQDLYSDKEGYFKLFREEGVINGSTWLLKYKELSERDNIRYHSKPSALFNQTEKEFFAECYPERQEFYSDKEGYFNIFKKENILNVKDWMAKFKGLSDRDNIRYHSNPWSFYNQSVKEFFSECYPERQEFYSDKEGYFKLFREEAITYSKTWIARYKDLNERDTVKYHSMPWTLFYQTEKEFFAECYSDRQEFYSDKEGYFELFREEDIISGKVWGKSYKELSKRHNVRYRSNPWDYFKQTQREFFSECYPDRQEFYSDKEGYFKLFRKENITYSKAWSKSYKLFSDVDGIKYHSGPWSLFNQTEKQFFVEYNEWLKDHPKVEREYRPAFLGEFSEMNKKWNTSNSKTNHKRLNADKSEWKKYHKLYGKLREAWGDDIPYKVIAKELKKRPDWVVGDFGCGENLLSKEITNKVHAFDHVAIDKNVTSCDITHVPLENNTLDVVVFSLSMMGTNYNEYFKEAHRVLKPMGVLMIAEPSTRWQDKEEDLKAKLTEAGFKLTGEIKYSERFIYVDAIKY